jgi:3-phenylpropionate/cinnamic acid dioxygenase small subunit
MDNPGVTAQEYVDIQNLYAAYNLASDAGDAQAYASCFTEDGVLRLEPLDVTVRGRASFVAFKEKDAAGRGGKYRRHWNGSLHLEKIDRDTVRGRCYFHAYNGKPGELPTLADAGVYEDTIVRVGGTWKYAKRHLTLDGSTWSAPPTTARESRS